MKSFPFLALVVGLIGTLITGCGTVGPPVPPEFVGIGAKVQREKDKERVKEEARRKELEKQQALPQEPAVQPEAAAGKGEPTAESESEEAMKEEEDVVLPSLRPIGTPR
mgnify:CR=1 FL=1